MERIKHISQKIDKNNFSTPIPIGVDGVNVDLESGLNLEEKLSSVDRQIAGKAPTNHASTSQDYGVGGKNTYGHLKTSEIYTREEKDAEHTVVSQKGMVDLFNTYLINILRVFYIMGANDTMVSVLNTGWIRDNENSKLWLLSNYFKIEKDLDGSDILITKDVRNQKDDGLFDILGESFLMYSLDTAWLVNDAKMRLVSDYFEVKTNNKGELVLVIK